MTRTSEQRRNRENAGDAEKYKEEDDRQKERIAARNQLESYVFNVKQAVEESSKLPESEKNT